MGCLSAFAPGICGLVMGIFGSVTPPASHRPPRSEYQEVEVVELGEDPERLGIRVKLDDDEIFIVLRRDDG